MFIYGFKHGKTDKVDNYILIGCESDELFEIDKLFNLWSNKFINEAVQNRKFKITGWLFMTLVKRNNFFKVQGICMELKKEQHIQKIFSFHSSQLITDFKFCRSLSVFGSKCFTTPCHFRVCNSSRVFNGFCFKS